MKELDKMLLVKEESQIIGEFLEWAQSGKCLVIAEWITSDADGNKLLNPRLLPMQFTIEKLLAEFFEIDLNKVENERRALLKEIQGS